MGTNGKGKASNFWLGCKVCRGELRVLSWRGKWWQGSRSIMFDFTDQFFCLLWRLFEWTFENERVLFVCANLFYRTLQRHFFFALKSSARLSWSRRIDRLCLIGLGKNELLIGGKTFLQKWIMVVFFPWLISCSFEWGVLFQRAVLILWVVSFIVLNLENLNVRGEV